MKIHVNMPAFRGAIAKFNRKMVNEDRFSDAQRCKRAYLEFNPAGRSSIEWLCQEADCHTSGWSEEIKRAFIVNGAKPGHVIDVKFGSRDTGYIEEFELEID